MLDNLKSVSSRVSKPVEIIEFFGYFCPYCNFLEPILEEWLSKNSNSIFFRRIPVDFSISSNQQYLDSPYTPQKKLYFTLRAMGKLQEINKRVFRAIHVLNQKLDTDEAIISFALKQGLEESEFLDIYRSFAVKVEVLHSTELQKAYKVDSVPMLVINGRYIISPPIFKATQNSNNSYASLKSMLKTMDTLIIEILSRQD